MTPTQRLRDKQRIDRQTAEASGNGWRTAIATLMEALSARGIPLAQQLNYLTDHGLISDHVVTWDDVATEDARWAVKELENMK